MELAARYLRLSVLVAVMLSLSAAPALAVTSTDLIEHGKGYDRESVAYRGEVIGDVMRRGEFAVVNIHDGANAIGVWLPIRAAGEITKAGRYGVVGDRVEVHGVFYRACAEHGGDICIHGERLTVLTPGKVTREVFDGRQALVTVIFLGLAIGLAVWERRRHGSISDWMGEVKHDD